MNELTNEPRVERCVCHEVSFEEILRLSRDRGWGFEELRRETRCCTGCAMCEPYVRIVLETGRTSLPVIG